MPGSPARTDLSALVAVAWLLVDVAPKGARHLPDTPGSGAGVSVKDDLSEAATKVQPNAQLIRWESDWAERLESEK